jgi:alkylhydroperoxidase family enzyme
MEVHMTQRLSGLSDQEATGLAKEIFDASTLFMGRSSNLLRILTKHSPYLARWFFGFVAAVRQPNLGATSDVRLRNLATIKTSLANECSYCSAHTSIFGQALGLKDADLEALKSDAYKTNPAFSERERAAIAWSEAMTKNTAARDEAVWKEMKRLFSEAEIVEISLACSMFNMINRLNDSFWTELESLEYNKRQGNAVAGRTVDEIEAYAAGFPATGKAERQRRQPAAAE